MAKNPKSLRLAATQLSRQIKSSRLLSSKSQESQQKYETLPQLRATEALEFGIGVQHPGYNLYIAGESGIGRLEYVLDYLEPIATRADSPSDWIYVNNFDDPREPHSIRLPPGEGTKFRDDLDEFIEALLATFPAIFEHPSFLQKKTGISREFEEIYDNAIVDIEVQAADQNIAVYREDGTITFSPIINGEIADEAEFAKLKGEVREEFHQNVASFEDQLNDALLELPKWQRAQKDQVRQLFNQTITQSLKPLFDELQQAYQGHAGILLYLAQMNRDLPKIIKELFAGDEKENTTAETLPSHRKILENRYLPNLFVRSGGQSGAPVIVEPNPTYANLFGQINYLPDHGSFNSDFQQIVAGSLHRANGGYLIADMEKVMQNQQTWDALKRMLRQTSITIEQSTLDNALGLPSSIKPESIPINVKIILLGPRQVYYAMSELDSDFDELFQVLVDFDSELDASEENLKQFTQLMQHKCQQLKFSPLSSRAVGRLAEYACRLAEHQQKISANIDHIMEVVTEANFWCTKEQSKQITNGHITKALATRKRRNARLSDQTLEDFLEGNTRIKTEGFACGQVNGLSIIQVGETRFGCPIRITASVHPGTRGVVDIEREVELGQSVHSKGVLLLAGFLSGHFAKKIPLAISAHIAVEQSYGYIDGDSASLAELCALLSALVDVPLNQQIAMTGAVSQLGEVQKIGGVNEKIEGFFSLCAARGLTGEQGVIIPTSNQINLMLSEEVVDAVKQKQFHIYAVDNVDQTIEIISGVKMGSPSASGEYSPKTLGARIVNKLVEFASITNQTRFRH